MLKLQKKFSFATFEAHLAKKREEEEKRKLIAFGTKQERPTIPDNPPTFRIGTEYFYKSPFSVGPGSYEVERMTSNSYLQKKKTSINKKGWGFSNRGSPRMGDQLLSDAPPPTLYQTDIPTYKAVEPAAQPFGFKAKRVYFDDKHPCPLTPGPGSHELTGVIGRKLEKKSDFGGSTRIVMPVTVKCVTQFTERCVVCYKTPTGDYWQMKKEVMCRPCYDAMSGWKDPEMSNWNDSHPYSGRLEQFKKFRNCDFMHDHNGTDKPVQTVSDKEIKKLQRKEAYLNLYF